MSAPIAVPVEILTEERRVFRLAREVGEGGLILETPAPFEPGRPVHIRFALPDGEPLALRAELTTTGDEAERDGSAGGCRLDFIDLPAAARAALGRYIVPRLGLPPPPA